MPESRLASLSRRQLLLNGGLIVAIVVALLAIARLGFETLSSARAYVGGEGLWSKAQKDAVYHLVRYSYNHDSLLYAGFRSSLEVYRGDREARLAALAPDPDWDRVHAGLLRGGNHPEDVHGMGVFLRRFRSVPFVAEAIASWEEGDSLMQRLEAVGARLEAEARAGRLEGPAQAAAVTEIERLAIDLGRVEHAFSTSISTGARAAARWFFAGMVGTAALLVGLGALVLRGVGQKLRASEEARRVVEAQLRQAQKMEAVGQLTGGIAHDFNNLLTVILTNVRLIEHGLPAEAGHVREDLDELRIAAQRGAEMIKKLLAFSRSGQFTFEPLALERILSESVRLLRRILPASVRIEAQFDPAAPATRTDPAAVQQMVLNLATNARDAMPGGGSLTLALAPFHMTREFVQRRGWGRIGEYAAITIRDTGSGMPPAVMDRLFEPFFTTKPPGVGTGLGMPMVYGLMKQHSGYVDVESAPGAGTSVTLYFPAVDGAPAVQRAAAPAVPHGGGTILVVEDEASLRRAARRLLERQGYEVLEAAIGEEGLRLAREHRAEIRLVLSDVVMPKMGGPALHAALEREGIAIPFLFTSGYAGRAMPDGVKLPQGVPLLPKPWDAQELATWVSDAIRRE
ncbi:MAG: ATP-binding protein [Gemmatimonadota bacterium]|nr:ATP-binding protein [Gemmatimonadota bacterium]